MRCTEAPHPIEQPVKSGIETIAYRGSDIACML
jgi:hypothetical protein